MFGKFRNPETVRPERCEMERYTVNRAFVSQTHPIVSYCFTELMFAKTPAPPPHSLPFSPTTVCSVCPRSAQGEHNLV